MRSWLVGFLLLGASLGAAEAPAVEGRSTVIVVGGAAGEAEFAPDIAQQMEAWGKAAQQAGAKHVGIGAGDDDRDRLKGALEGERKDGGAELWLVLIGHGTFDGKEAKFNLRGPDVSAAELAEWLKPFTRPLAVIDASSSSAPFMGKLSAKNRVIVTSTRSGYQMNYARFGKYMAEAIGDSKADLDRDGQISLLEAYLSGSHRTAEFYKTEGRLATEHALIDDNGDGIGTPADWFRGVRATKKAQGGAEVDGARAHQFHLVRSAAEQQLAPTIRARRDKLELEIGKLRDAKSTLPEEAYYQRLEKLMLELAELYEST